MLIQVHNQLKLESKLDLKTSKEVINRIKGSKRNFRGPFAANNRFDASLLGKY